MTRLGVREGEREAGREVWARARGRGTMQGKGKHMRDDGVGVGACAWVKAGVEREKECG